MPDKPYIVSQGLTLLREVAEKGGMDVNVEDYLKRSHGNYSDALDLMMDENGYNPYDEKAKKQVHDNFNLPLLSSDYILKNKLSDKEQKDLETKSNELFDKIWTGKGIEEVDQGLGVGRYEKIYDAKDKARLTVELNTINERLRRDSELRDLMPDVIKAEESPLGQKTYSQLKREAVKPPKVQVGQFGVYANQWEQQKKIQEDAVRERDAKAAVDKMELDKEYLASPVYLTANTAAVTSKAEGKNPVDALINSKKMLNDAAAKLSRQYDMALEKFNVEPTEENKARVDLIGEYITAQSKEIAKGDSVANAVSIYSRKKAREVEALAQSQSGIEQLGTFISNAASHAKNVLVNGIDDFLNSDSNKINLDDYQGKQLYRGISEADIMQQSKYRGNFRERYVDVDGQKMVIDQHGDVLYGVDDNFRPVNGDISKYVNKYEGDRESYEPKADYSFTRLLGTSAQVVADMVPIIATNAVVGALTAPLPGGQAKTIQALGNILVSGVSMFSDNLKKNIELGKGYNYAWNAAVGTTFVQALIEQVGGFEARTGKVLGESARKAMKTKLEALAADHAGRTLSRKSFIDKANGIVKEYIGEGLEESSQDITGTLSDHLFYGIDAEIDWNNHFNTWASLPIAVGGIRGITNGIKSMQDRGLLRRGYNAAMSNLSGYNDVVDAMVADGKISEKEGRIKKEVLAGSKADYDGVNGYDNISPADKKKLISILESRDRNRMMANYIEIGPGKDEYNKKAEDKNVEFNELWAKLNAEGKKGGHGDVSGLNWDINEEDVKNYEREEQKAPDNTGGVGESQETGQQRADSSPQGRTEGDTGSDGGGQYGQRRVLTKEAEDLLSGMTSGTKPLFITKNLEKIASENGIEVTDSMSADDVVNALKNIKDESERLRSESSSADGGGQQGDSAGSKQGVVQETMQEAVPPGEPVSVLEKDNEGIKEQSNSGKGQVGVEAAPSIPLFDVYDNTGRVFKDSEGNEGTINTDEGGKVEFRYKGGVKELGNIEDIYEKGIGDYGLSSVESVKTEGDQTFSIGGKTYVNRYSTPQIQIDDDGVSIELEQRTSTGGYNGRGTQFSYEKVTLKGSQAEEIVYQLQLEKINERQQEFERFIENENIQGTPQEGANKDNGQVSETKEVSNDRQDAGGANEALSTRVPRLGIDQKTFDSLIENLEKALPGVWGGIMSGAEFAKAVGDKTGKILRNADRVIYGFVGKDGKVYLNGKMLNANTPIHEYAHIWIKTAKDMRPDIYNRGLALIEKTFYLSNLLSQTDGVYADLIKKYKKGDKNGLLEEALAIAIGDEGESIVNVANKSRFKEWLGNLWNGIKEIFGFEKVSTMTADQLSKMSFVDFVRAVAGGLVSGERQFEMKAEVEGGMPLFMAKTKTQVVSEIKSMPLTHVSGANMGSGEASGTYISVEPENRYSHLGKLHKAEIDISNPYVASDFEVNELKNKALKQGIENFIKAAGLSDYWAAQARSAKAFDDDVLIPFYAYGLNEEIGKVVTDNLKAEGYDSLYFPQSDNYEGYVVVFDKSKVKLTPAESEVAKAKAKVEASRRKLQSAWQELKAMGVVSDPYENAARMKRLIDAAIEFVIQTGAKTKAEVMEALSGYKISENHINNILKAVRAYWDPLDQEIIRDLSANTDSNAEATRYLGIMLRNMSATKDPVRYGHVLALENALVEKIIEYNEMLEVPEDNARDIVLNKFAASLYNYKVPSTRVKNVDITGAYKDLIDTEVFGTDMQEMMLHASTFLSNWHSKFRRMNITNKEFFEIVSGYLQDRNANDTVKEPIANAAYSLLSQLQKTYKNQKYWDVIYDILNVPNQALRRHHLGIALALGTNKNSEHKFSRKLEDIEEFKAKLDDDFTDEELDEDSHEDIKQTGAELRESAPSFRKPLPVSNKLRNAAKKNYKEVSQVVINKVRDKIKSCL